MIFRARVSPSASSRLPDREARAGHSDARLTLVVIDQVGAFAGRLSPGAGPRCGPVARREWVAISSAACWASTSQGACPPGTSYSLAPCMWSIDRRACSMERYGSSDPIMKIVGVVIAASSAVVRTNRNGAAYSRPALRDQSGAGRAAPRFQPRTKAWQGRRHSARSALIRRGDLQAFYSSCLRSHRPTANWSSWSLHVISVVFGLERWNRSHQEAGQRHQEDH